MCVSLCLSETDSSKYNAYVKFSSSTFNDSFKIPDNKFFVKLESLRCVVSSSAVG